jgi:uncharacterized protein YutE (UPF0331/DUF86 family)
LQPLRKKSKLEFDQDPYLRDIVERNLEIAAQCCIDISHRIISSEKAQKPQDYYEAIIRMGELAVLPVDFARKLAPIAGFRNILIHEYLSVDWDEVYKHLQDLNDIIRFAEFIREWLRKRATEDN